MTPDIERTCEDGCNGCDECTDYDEYDVFPEPDFAKAHELLQAGGMTLDAISASNMRHVISGVREIVEEGLKG